MVKYEVYTAAVELQPLLGCPLDPEIIAGAFTTCYISERSQRLAIEQLKASFEENKLKLIEMKWCLKSTEVDWESPFDVTAMDLINQAFKSGDVVYSVFDVWEHSDPDTLQ